MPRRKVSLFGVNFDSLVTTVTGLAFGQSVASATGVAATVTRNRAIADPAHSRRRPGREKANIIDKRPERPVSDRRVANRHFRDQWQSRRPIGIPPHRSKSLDRIAAKITGKIRG